MKVVIPGLCASLTYILGLVSVAKFNVEAKTLTIYLAGHLAGPVSGAITGILASILHQLLNPFGPADLFLCVGQIVAWSATGWAGAWCRPGGVNPPGMTSSRLELETTVVAGPIEPGSAAFEKDVARLEIDRPGRGRLAIRGATLTLAYHIITDWAESKAYGVTFWFFFAGGFVPPCFFTPVHVVSNALLFALVIPILWPYLERFRRQFDA